MQNNRATTPFIKTVFKATALAASIALASGCGQAAEPKQAKVEPTQAASGLVASSSCQTLASEEQARALIDRLYPAANYVSFEQLTASADACLLEVELKADANSSDPLFFYVLPGGELALPGPLLDRRNIQSYSASASAATPAAEAEAAALAAQAQTSAAELSGALGRLQSAMDQAVAMTGGAATSEPAVLRVSSAADKKPVNVDDPEAPYVREPGKTFNQTLLGELKKNPIAKNVQTTKLDAPAAQVYVLYDSTCPYCAKLFKEQDAIAKKFNINFNWVPSYIGEAGWVHAAHTVKELEKSNELGVKALYEGLGGKTRLSSPELVELAKELSEDDYYKAKPSAVFLHRVGLTAGEPVGTPLIYIEGNNGGVSSAYGALGVDDEWQELIDKANASE